MPKVSVIIPCYNQAQYLKECLDSVMKQTFQDFEVIVMDDGSTQGKDIFARLNYPKTKIIHQQNSGLPTARNKAILLAKGEYIFPLDADDKITPDTLEKAVHILDKNSEIGIVGGKTAFFGIKSGVWDLPRYRFPDILAGNCLVASCLFRKSDWEQVGGYNPNMKYGLEDWDFWLSVIELGKSVYQFDDVFLCYRQHYVSMIKKLKHKKAIQMLHQIVLNHPRLYAEYPLIKLKILHPKIMSILKRMIKIVVPIVPVKSWRHALRNIYRGV